MLTGGFTKLPRLDSLTSLRFFAALVVVLHHTTRDLGPIPLVSSVLTLGTTGVGFFFVLSGFVLMWSSRDSDTKRAFYRRRFARVYPMHLLTFLISIPVLLLIGQDFGAAEATTAAVLLQGWVPSSEVYFGMNAPSWSLSNEMLFYALFPFAVPVLKRLSIKQAWTVLLALVLASLVISIGFTLVAGNGEQARFLLYVFPPYRFLGFLAGCCAARLMLLGYRSRVSVPVAVGSIVVSFIALYGVQRVLGGVGHGVEDAVLLPFILLLIVAAASSDIRGSAKVLVDRRLIRLGEWSFALYLTHWLLLETVAYFLPEITDSNLAVRALADIVFVVTAVAVSGLAYHYVEKPMEKRLRLARKRILA